jgi:arginine-tRNA-protein transferase
MPPNDMDALPTLLQFYATSPYPCSYLPGRIARSQVASPPYLIGDSLYSLLVQSGFRRGGQFVYRPFCDNCTACVPVRLPAGRLAPSRSQRRALKSLDALEAQAVPLAFDEAHYTLYRRYLAARHPGGGMDGDNRAQYARFVLESPIDSLLYEFRDKAAGALRMVCLIDPLSDGLSSVYTFYDPDMPHLSLGTACILWQAALCRSLGLPYLYLGYWIAASPKMAYKSNFRPIEAYLGGLWRELSAKEIDAALEAAKRAANTACP